VGYHAQQQAGTFHQTMLCYGRLRFLQTVPMVPGTGLLTQVEDPALRETLGRAASQLYTALGDRMIGAEPEPEVVRSLQGVSGRLLSKSRKPLCCAPT